MYSKRELAGDFFGPQSVGFENGAQKPRLGTEYGIRRGSKRVKLFSKKKKTFKKGSLELTVKRLQLIKLNRVDLDDLFAPFNLDVFRLFVLPWLCKKPSTHGGLWPCG